MNIYLDNSLTFNFHGIDLQMVSCCLLCWEARENQRDREEVSWYVDWLQYPFTIFLRQGNRIETHTTLKKMVLLCFVRNSTVIEALGQLYDYSIWLVDYFLANSTKHLQICLLPHYFFAPADIIFATTENSSTRLFQAVVSHATMENYCY